MKKTLIQTFFTCFCCIFLLLLLFQSKECIMLASNGLLIWYRNMIPSLFPFMILSGFLIRSGLSVKIGQWLQPALGSLFRLPPQMLYAIFMGFLCGFPMGAKMVSDMLDEKQISEREGEFLLAFCNNIGPLYMLGYVIPLFEYKNPWTILGGMYLIPLCYGLFLRYLFPHYFFSSFPLLSMCSFKTENLKTPTYLESFQQALSSAIEQITMLGGCMVFFNCMLILPQSLQIFLSQTTISSYIPLYFSIFKALVEIGGGLQQLACISSIPVFLPFSLLTFGGLSCIVQTCFITKNTGLRIGTYIMHKFIQSCIFIILIYVF